MISKKNYDSRCFELAKYFLADEPMLSGKFDKAEELAELIQTTIEDWIRYEKYPPDGRVSNVRETE